MNPNPLRSLLYRSGKAMARPENVSRSSHAKQHLSFNLLAAVALVCVLVGGFGQPLSEYFASTFSTSPSILLPNTNWKVLHHDQCGEGCANLWRSPHTAADEDFSAKIEGRAGQDFWIGIEVTPADKEIILARGARTLIIGRVNGSFMAYVNGDRRLHGRGGDILPVTLAIGDKDLEGKYPLRIALKIRQSLANPLHLNEANSAAGFFTPDRATAFRDQKILTTFVLPTALGLAALLAALVFVSLWVSVRLRNEYFIFGLFCFCLFCAQIFGWSSLAFKLSGRALGDISLAIRVTEGILAAYLGLAYSRSKLSIFFVISVLGAIFFGFVHRGWLTSSAAYGPLCFSFGAFTCFAQAALGRQDGFRDMNPARVRQRTQRLHQFGWLLLCLGVIYFLGGLKILGLGFYLYQPAQFATVALIGAFLFRDYRDFDLNRS